MPNKSRKDKTSKSGRSSKSGSKHQDNQDPENEGSNKKNSSSVPPTAQVMRVKQPSSQVALKKERRQSASCFPLSNNRELHKLPAFKGTQTGGCHDTTVLCVPAFS